ncbi:MAG: hypothetical protein LBV41_12525 [Cytophagaceae bacterium]|jgi:hypothetical protein|nr:hypothetical protein [Cytophagaceae bacterium]
MANKKIKDNKKSTHPTEKKSWKNVLIINIVLIVVGALFLNYYTKRPEIVWIYRNLLAANYATIQKHPDATLDERLASKLKFNYVYLAYVRDNTPDTAVILFPKRDVILKQPTKFNDAELSGVWISSFIYPRKAVIDSDASTENITHIAVMNGWGYDRLNYSVANPPENCVLPVHRIGN